jgi:hypothetical protein
MGIRLRAPSPTTVIACIALFLALGGGGYIALAHGGADAAKKKKVKQGPAGPAGPAGANGVNGTNGTNGVNGLNGTARAYARVLGSGISPCAPGCTFDHSKGVAGVTRLGAGDYCVVAPGIDASTVSAAVSVDFAATNSPAGNASAMSFTNCNGTGFEVMTSRQPSTTVCTNSGCTTTANVAGNAVPDDTVSFTIVIP